MPPLERMGMTDRLVMWEFARSSRSGDPLVYAGVELDCRWEEGMYEMLDAQNQRLVVDAVIAAKQNIPLESLVWEGSLADLESEIGTSLSPRSRLYQVVIRNRADDVKGRDNKRRFEFGLRRFKNRLPDVVERV